MMNDGAKLDEGLNVRASRLGQLNPLVFPIVMGIPMPAFVKGDNPGLPMRQSFQKQISSFETSPETAYG